MSQYGRRHKARACRYKPSYSFELSALAKYPRTCFRKHCQHTTRHDEGSVHLACWSINANIILLFINDNYAVGNVQNKPVALRICYWKHIWRNHASSDGEVDRLNGTTKTNRSGSRQLKRKCRYFVEERMVHFLPRR